MKINCRYLSLKINILVIYANAQRLTVSALINRSISTRCVRKLSCLLSVKRRNLPLTLMESLVYGLCRTYTACALSVLLSPQSN